MLRSAGYEPQEDLAEAYDEFDAAFILEKDRRRFDVFHEQVAGVIYLSDAMVSRSRQLFEEDELSIRQYRYPTFSCSSLSPIGRMMSKICSGLPKPELRQTLSSKKSKRNSITLGEMRSSGRLSIKSTGWKIGDMSSKFTTK